MQKQTVPNIDFKHFVIAEIPGLFQNNKVKINSEYQRGDIWNSNQKYELIKSIVNSYSIGVLVLFINDQKQYEILDGQQRLITIMQYLEDKIDLSKTEIQKYSDLTLQEKTHFDAYCIYYLKLMSHDPDSKEEDIVQTFLRLQEGTPLNKAEKINAYRGKFKDIFRCARENQLIFKYLGKEKRFRWRQLAAELLLLELESNYEKKIFPGLDLASLIGALKKYKRQINSKKVTFYIGNLDCLERSLNYLLTALQPSTIVMFYLLMAYLRKNKANNRDLLNEFSEFAKEFMQQLSSFSIYDANPPVGMSKSLFDKYKKFKTESKIMTTSDSIKNRFDIILNEYNRLYPIIIRDPIRLHDNEQRRNLFYRQKGTCPLCKKQLDFRAGLSVHHIFPHSKGGRTDDLNNAQLLHEKCHHILEKKRSKKSS